MLSQLKRTSFGLYPAESLGKYLLDDEKATVVRRIFDGYSTGQYSLPALARALNDDGIATPRDAAFWRISTLRNILRNTVYKGEPVSYKSRAIHDETRIGTSHPINGLTITKSHAQVPTSEEHWIRLSSPAIVSVDLWQLANERLAQNRAIYSGNPTRVRMLSGRVVCPTCGGKVISHGSASNGKRYDYYICREWLTHRDRSKEDYCKCLVYPIEQIERAVVTAISQACEAPNAIAAAIEAYRPTPRFDGSKNEATCRKQLERDLSALALEEQATVKAQIEGIKAGASPAAYTAVFQDIAERRRVIQEKLVTLSRTGRDSASIGATTVTFTKPSIATKVLSDVETVLTSEYVSDAEKRTAVGMIVEKVVCLKEGADVYFMPTIYGNQTLQITLTTSSKSVGETSIRP